MSSGVQNGVNGTQKSPASIVIDEKSFVQLKVSTTGKSFKS